MTTADQIATIDTKLALAARLAPLPLDARSAELIAAMVAALEAKRAVLALRYTGEVNAVAYHGAKRR